MSYSSLTNNYVPASTNNYTQGRNGYRVCKITPHHMAAVWTGTRCAQSFQDPNRQASSNYCIGVDGDIVCSVEEEYRAWTSGNGVNDSQAITIEVSDCDWNWNISDKSWNSLVNLCVDICKRYNFRLNYDGTANGSLTRHNMFQNTSCPGIPFQTRFAELATTVNAKLDGTEVPIAPSNPTNTGSRTDQILEVGSYVQINKVMKVTNVDAVNNLIGISELTDGEPTESYHWFDPTPIDEVTSNGVKSGNQVFAVGELCKVSGTYEVLDVDIASDSCKIKIGSRENWVACAPCTEVEAITTNSTPTDSPTTPTSNADQVLTKGSKVVINGVFAINEVIRPNATYPNGAIGCYATCYGSPCGVSDYIPCGVLATCNQDGSGVNYNGIMRVGGYWTCNKEFTVQFVETPTSVTKDGVAILVADGVSFRINPAVLYETSNS